MNLLCTIIMIQKSFIFGLTLIIHKSVNWIHIEDDNDDEMHSFWRFKLLDYQPVGSFQAVGRFKLLDYQPAGSFQAVGRFKLLDYQPVGSFQAVGRFKLLDYQPAGSFQAVGRLHYHKSDYLIKASP